MSGEEFCEKLEMKIKNGQWLIRSATARASSIRYDKLYLQKSVYFTTQNWLS